MPIVVTCSCGKELKAKAESAGKRSKCPYCGGEVLIPAVATDATAGAAALFATNDATSGFDWGLLDPDPKPDAAPPTAEAPKVSRTAPTISTAPKPESPTIKHDNATAPASLALDTNDKDKRYKVLTQKDMGFAVKFDAVKLEDTLNSLAHQGWLVKSALTIEMPSHSGPHDEVLIILERPPVAQANPAPA